MHDSWLLVRLSSPNVGVTGFHTFEAPLDRAQIAFKLPNITPPKHGQIDPKQLPNHPKPRHTAPQAESAAELYGHLKKGDAFEAPLLRMILSDFGVFEGSQKQVFSIQNQFWRVGAEQVSNFSDFLVGLNLPGGEL